MIPLGRRHISEWLAAAGGAVSEGVLKLCRQLGDRLRVHGGIAAGLGAGYLILALLGYVTPGGLALLMLLTAALLIGTEAAREGRGPVRLEQAPESRRVAQHWKAVIDAMQDAVVALDGEGIVLHRNGAVADLFPRIREGLPLTSATRNPELIEAVERAHEDGERAVVELTDRVPFARSITAVVSRIDHGEETGPTREPEIIIVFRDMTDQEKLAQMRADFIANASHELRTPLASLRGFVETLLGPAKDDPNARERFLGIMSAQATRMTQLIDDLLTLSRAEMRVHLPPRGVVELGDVLSFVAQALEPVALAGGTELDLEIAAGPANVRGDRDELVQVFQNLLQNAIKYGKAGGKVRIGLVREPTSAGLGRRVAVSIMDDGPGISAEHLPRLTERFYRVNVTQSREKGGTGLGLAIVKHIVSRHRGELRIASEVGKGSTFTVVLDEVPAPIG